MGPGEGAGFSEDVGLSEGRDSGLELSDGVGLSGGC